MFNWTLCLPFTKNESTIPGEKHQAHENENERVNLNIKHPYQNLGAQRAIF